RVLERMRNSAKRMEAMIDELLDLTHARLAPGLGLARTRAAIDLRALLARVTEELRTARGRDVGLAGLSSCPTTGDPERLLQLFSNLIGNAITHGKDGAPITARIASNGKEALVAIHNDGVIAADVLPTLFEPFHRERKPSGGLGLGLYIAKQIA